MHKGTMAKLAALTSAAAMLVGLAACGGGNAGSGTTANGGKSLVVNNVFDLKTLDPARDFEFTGKFVNRQTYETVLDYGDDGTNLKEVVPAVAQYTISDDAKVVTLTVDGSHTFSDGAKVTAEDVAFSLQRVIGVQGNPAFLLNDPAGKPVEVKQTDDKTVTLTSSVANPALPYILPNPSLAVLEKKVVEAHGGTTDANDKADEWLNSNSIGSGPYKVTSVDPKSEVKIEANDKYSGKYKPTYTNVVLQNVKGSTQKVNMQAGSAQLAFDVNQDDLKGLDGGNTKVAKAESLYTFFLWLNSQEQYGKQASDPKFVQAFRHAIDYDVIVDLAGEGAVQAPGIIPGSVEGSLESDESNTYDPAKAKKLLSESGYKGEPIAFEFSSEYNIAGVNLQTLAQLIQQQVKKVGINLELKPSPSTTFLDSYRSGKAQAGLIFWQADYPDPADYAAFGPDGSVGLRAGWDTTANATGAAQVKPAFDAASAATDPATRAKAWQEAQKAMNENGPFVPLVTPSNSIVYANSLQNVKANPMWYIDLALLK